jgi:tetratricopeptide (TPR) repeat protein
MPLDPELLQAGLDRHRAGDFEHAEAIYRRLLASDPNSVEVLNLLGAVSLDQGRVDQAGDYLREALRRNPAMAPVHDNLGLVLRAQGRLSEAEASFRRAIALDPRNGATYRNLAHCLLAAGETVEAVDILRQIASAAPSEVRAQFELAAALNQAGHPSEAIAAYQDVLRLQPAVVEAWLNLANLYFGQNDFAAAERAARRACELRPNVAEAHHVLGCALTKLARHDDAIGELQSAVRLKPQMSHAIDALGVALIEGGRYEAAIEHFRAAAAARGGDPDAWYNLASAYFRWGDVTAALENFERALTLRPDHFQAAHNRLAIRLLRGELLEAFPEYEARFRAEHPAFDRWPWRLWKDEPVAGRTVVLCPDPGFGDTLQFIRYAPLIKEQGARVVVVCNESQKAILRHAAGVDQLIAPDTPLEADYFVPMISLPERLHTSLLTIPAQVPYLFAEPRLVAGWRRRLGEFDGFKVGIVWQGNPTFPGDRYRSIRLHHFEPLSRVPGVRLVNLQKGTGVEQLADVAEAWSIIDFGDELDASAGAFIDTAAIMKNLDLIISSDTSAAHLAGALGVRVWVALQRVPDWRWLLEREDSPWYPTMRLFRQSRPDDWDEVFERIAGELAILIGEGPTE